MLEPNRLENLNEIDVAVSAAGQHPAGNRGRGRVLNGGRTAVWQARLVLLVMINIAQLWILSATIEAALAGHYKQLARSSSLPVFAGLLR